MNRTLIIVTEIFFLGTRCTAYSVELSIFSFKQLLSSTKEDKMMGLFDSPESSAANVAFNVEN